MEEERFSKRMQIKKEKKLNIRVYGGKFELVNGGIIRRSGKLSNRDKERRGKEGTR